MSSRSSAVRFLTRTFRNVLYVRDGKHIVRLWHSRTVVWVGSRWDGSWKTPATGAAGAGANPLPPLALAPWTRTAGTQTESQLEPATYAGVILHETGQFLLLCSLQLWQQLQRCRQTVQEYHCCLIHFTSVLQKQFAANDMFLREANSYKRALALRNSRLPSDASILQLVWAPPVGSGSECHIDSYVWPNIVMKQNTNCWVMCIHRVHPARDWRYGDCRFCY